MILAILLAGAPSATIEAAPSPTIAPATIDPAQVAAAFRDLCVAHWRDPDALHEAMMTAAVPFAAVPKRDPARPGETWRAGGLYLSYLAPDTPGPMPSPQCSTRGAMKGSADQLSFAGRVTDLLRLRGAATRTASGQALTEWPIADPLGPAKVIAMTRNAPGGGTELRIAILPVTQPPPPAP